MNATFMVALLIGGPPEEPNAERFGTVDVVHIGDERPTHIRVRVSVDGRSPETARDAYLTDLFKFLDRNGDGVLNGEESALVPAATDLAALLVQTHAGFYTAPGVAKRDELKPDEKGRVTPAAFLDHYRRGLPAIRVVFQGERGDRTEALTESLFRVLADKDGCITKREADEAGNRLAKFDANEDDLITPDEIAELAAGARQTRKRDVFVLPYEADALKAATNEHPDFTMRQAGAELTASLGRGAENGVALALTSPKTAPLSGAVRSSGAGYSIELRDGRLEFHADSTGADRPRDARTFLAQQFKAADAKGKGYLDPADVARPQFRFFGPILRIADRDNDGRLSEAELTAWFDLQDKGRRNFVTLVVSDEGRDLFGLLDANQDGRLDPREVRTLWSRLAPLNPSSESVSLSDLPSIVQVRFAQGPRDSVPPFREPLPPAKRPKRVSAWFEKMDRNDDGYVSRKEWLGTPARFTELDRDGDGLIDVPESLAAEKKP